MKQESSPAVKACGKDASKLSWGLNDCKKVSFIYGQAQGLQVQGSLRDESHLMAPSRVWVDT